MAVKVYKIRRNNLEQPGADPYCFSHLAPNWKVDDGTGTQAGLKIHQARWNKHGRSWRKLSSAMKHLNRFSPDSQQLLSIIECEVTQAGVASQQEIAIVNATNKTKFSNSRLDLVD